MSDSRRRIRGNPAVATPASLRAAATAIVVATATLALAGCASDPDLSAVESGLAGVDNVTVATASPQHSNFRGRRR